MLGWMKKIGIHKEILGWNSDNQREELLGCTKKILIHEKFKSENQCGKLVKKLVTEKNFN